MNCKEIQISGVGRWTRYCNPHICCWWKKHINQWHAQLPKHDDLVTQVTLQRTNLELQERGKESEMTGKLFIF